MPNHPNIEARRVANKAGNRGRRKRGRPLKKRHLRRDFARMTIGFSEDQIRRIDHLVDLRGRVLLENVDEMAPMFRDAGMRDIERQIAELESRLVPVEPALAVAGQSA